MKSKKISWEDFKVSIVYFGRTEMHSVIGTAIYMSPEVMRGSEDDNGQGGYGRSTVCYMFYCFHLCPLSNCNVVMTYLW